MNSVLQTVQANGISTYEIMRGSRTLACAALKAGHHIGSKGLRHLRHDSKELLEIVLELIGFVESGCQSPLLNPSNVDIHIKNHNFEDPAQYAESLLLLARDVDAHPWGAFGFLQPDRYLPFLLQLAGDLITESGGGEEEKH